MNIKNSAFRVVTLSDLKFAISDVDSGWLNLDGFWQRTPIGLSRKTLLGICLQQEKWIALELFLNEFDVPKNDLSLKQRTALAMLETL